MARSLTFFTPLLWATFGIHVSIFKNLRQNLTSLTPEKQAGTCKSANGFHFAVRLFIY